MRNILIIFLNLLVSCTNTSRGLKTSVLSNNGQVFSYVDISGTFELSREVKFQDNQIASRVQIQNLQDSTNNLLEKTFTLSKVGSTKGANGRRVAIRPEISQHTVWFEGKKYFSQIKLNTKEKVFEIVMQSPEEKWNGLKKIKVPKGNIFCFYSQLPECLIASGIIDELEKTERRPRFYIVWDSWPYHQEHFTGLGPSITSRASLGLEAKNTYIIEFEGQSISLHFSKNRIFVRMLWTAQGISILPPGEMQEETIL